MPTWRPSSQGDEDDMYVPPMQDLEGDELCPLEDEPQPLVSDVPRESTYEEICRAHVESCFEASAGAMSRWRSRRTAA